MKLMDILTESQGKGYASLTLTDKSTKDIHQLLDSLNIKDGIQDLHITLMYDRSNPTIEMKLDDKNYRAEVIGVEALGEPGTKWYAITLVLKSPEIVKRHKEYIDAGFKHSYPDFSPHLSLKYKPSKEEIELIKQNLDKFKELTLVFGNEKNEVIKE